VQLACKDQWVRLAQRDPLDSPGLLEMLAIQVRLGWQVVWAPRERVDLLEQRDSQELLVQLASLVQLEQVVILVLPE